MNFAQLPRELQERVADQLEVARDLCRFRQTCRASQHLGAPSVLEHPSPIPYTFVHDSYVVRRPGQKLSLPQNGVATSGPCQRASLQRRLAAPPPTSTVRLLFSKWWNYRMLKQEPLPAGSIVSVSYQTFSLAHTWTSTVGSLLRMKYPSNPVVCRRIDIPWPTDCVLVVCVFADKCSPQNARRLVTDRSMDRFYCPTGSSPTPRVDVVIECPILLDHWLDDGRLYMTDLHWDGVRASQTLLWKLATLGITGLAWDYWSPGRLHYQSYLRLLRGVEVNGGIDWTQNPLEEAKRTRQRYEEGWRAAEESNRGKTMYQFMEWTNTTTEKELKQNGLATYSMVWWTLVLLLSQFGRTMLRFAKSTTVSGQSAKIKRRRSPANARRGQ